MSALFTPHAALLLSLPRAEGEGTLAEETKLESVVREQNPSAGTATVTSQLSQA
jgi:hypothetical protein